ncbi:MAG: 30S ribosomal protein S12 methylthiotransferase RimO [Candidatus Marinimicrobia bacterium]|nr:30S ribosomal protein S12 methylthiotransferase RimO [Candidatus Neomarinimicrobiota bacterium]
MKVSNEENKISLVTLGCAKNLVDTEILVGGLKNNSYKIVEKPLESDVVIVNTCGFLDKAREESVDTILDLGRLKKEGKIKKLIAMGCFTERYGDAVEDEIPEVDKVFGSEQHASVLTYLTGKDFQRNDPDFQRSTLTPKHYAYLKISEGCDNVCSFCSIPLMRGLQQSQPIAWNVMEAKRLAQSGVKELLVIGQDTTTYGWDFDKKKGIHDLFDELDDVDGIDWIRFHYAHPAHLNNRMIKRYSCLNRLIPYIDMPVQHGSAKMLKDMRRGLGPDGIKKRIDNLRNANPNIAIRTSMIVGFPGEGDKEFKELLDFIEEVQFDRLGVFTYSEEEGTHGAEVFEDVIPAEVKDQRKEQVMMLQQNINYRKNKNLVGTTQKVLVDIANEQGTSLGRTYRDSPEIDNYVKIKGKVQPGEFYNVKITDAMEYDLIGEICE